MPNLDAAFSAMADPTRRAILARLALGETTVMELAEPFEMTQPAVSRHLKVLEDAGLILRRVEGAKRLHQFVAIASRHACPSHFRHFTTMPLQIKGPRFAHQPLSFQLPNVGDTIEFSPLRQ